MPSGVEAVRAEVGDFGIVELGMVVAADELLLVQVVELGEAPVGVEAVLGVDAVVVQVLVALLLFWMVVRDAGLDAGVEVAESRKAEVDESQGEGDEVELGLVGLPPGAELELKLRFGLFGIREII